MRILILHNVNYVIEKDKFKKEQIQLFLNK
jgi:hypothetical protein